MSKKIYKVTQTIYKHLRRKNTNYEITTINWWTTYR